VIRIGTLPGYPLPTPWYHLTFLPAGLPGGKQGEAADGVMELHSPLHTH